MSASRKGSPLALSLSKSLRDDSIDRSSTSTTPRSPDMSYYAESKDGGGTLRRTHNKRSSDVLNHTKHLDEEHKNRKDSEVIRETKRADIVTDDIGGLMGVNQYLILKELGKGSFAEVKLCKKVTGPLSPENKAEDKAGGGKENDEDGELYAIKIFSKSLLLRRKQFSRGGGGKMSFTTDLDKVQREIAIMKKGIHPNLVGLYEVIDDTAHDALYLVLEYVPGGAIMEYNPEEKRYHYHKSRDGSGTMTETQAARCFCDLLAGLVYLHVHHIAHRDLKPENVLIDRHGRCKIADFGVAHYFEEEEKKVETELRQLYRSNSRGFLKQTDGTWCFWAPEMCKAQPFSGYKCDIWAAGVCLWVFIYGSLPFNEETPDELFHALAEKELHFPGDKNTSPELQDLLESFLKKNPDDRISIDDALDHPWTILADDEGSSEGGGGMDDASSTTTSETGLGFSRGGRSLRARAHSFQRISVTKEEINGAIRATNEFVLVSKLRKKLTKKLQQARDSLVRMTSPSVSPAVSPAASPGVSPEGSRSNTPIPPLTTGRSTPPTTTGRSTPPTASTTTAGRSTPPATTNDTRGSPVPFMQVVGPLGMLLGSTSTTANNTFYCSSASSSTSRPTTPSNKQASSSSRPTTPTSKQANNSNVTAAGGGGRTTPPHRLFDSFGSSSSSSFSTIDQPTSTSILDKKASYSSSNTNTTSTTTTSSSSSSAARSRSPSLFSGWSSRKVSSSSSSFSQPHAPCMPTHSHSSLGENSNELGRKSSSLSPPPCMPTHGHSSLGENSNELGRKSSSLSPPPCMPTHGHSSLGENSNELGRKSSSLSPPPCMPTHGHSSLGENSNELGRKSSSLSPPPCMPTHGHSSLGESGFVDVVGKNVIRQDSLVEGEGGVGERRASGSSVSSRGGGERGSTSSVGSRGGGEKRGSLLPSIMGRGGSGGLPPRQGSKSKGGSGRRVTINMGGNSEPSDCTVS